MSGIIVRILSVLSIVLPSVALADVQGSTWGAVKGLYREGLTDSTAEKAMPQPPTTQGPWSSFPSGWKFPFCGSWGISCGYGCGLHQGNDFYAIDWNLAGWSDYGQAVTAPASGRVVYAGSRGSYGNVVEVDAGNSWFYRIAHLRDYAVRAGQWVYLGTYLGTCGNSGTAQGPHIHFAVYFPALYAGNIVQIGTNIWGHGMSVPQNGISGQSSLVEGGSYPSGQYCQSR